jgi:hypothetical protein
MEPLTSSEGSRRRRPNLPLPTAHIPPAAEVLTRKQAATYLCEHGYPISLQMLRFYGMAANRPDGPKVAGVWGRLIMYRREDLLDWARARAGITVQSNV